MKLLEHNNNYYNLETALKISFPGALENQIDIIFADNSKVTFICDFEFTSDIAYFINFIKDPEATYFSLSGLDWDLT